MLASFIVIVKVECEDEKWIPKELFPLFSDVITIISGWANQKNNGENLLSYAMRPSLVGLLVNFAVAPKS